MTLKELIKACIAPEVAEKYRPDEEAVVLPSSKPAIVDRSRC
jgi:hypothetical protein